MSPTLAVVCTCLFFVAFTQGIGPLRWEWFAVYAAAWVVFGVMHDLLEND